MHLKHPLKLAWFQKLRWLAIAFQSIITMVAYCVLDLPLPINMILMVSIIAGLTNIALNFIQLSRKLSETRIIGSMLSLDTLLLSLLLYFSGGPLNPFSIVYVLHIVVSGLLLGEVWTWIITLQSVVFYALLFLFESPFTNAHDHSMGMGGHLAGMWIAFTIVALLLGFFQSKIAKSLSEHEQNLNELKAKQSFLQAITSLAAGAAHELATPLSTIALIASDLNSMPVSPHQQADLALLLNEVGRCRTILDEMANGSGTLIGEGYQKFNCLDLLKEIGGQLKPGQEFKILQCPKAACMLAPKLALRKALSCLIDNAIQASSGHAVEVSIIETQAYICFEVKDYGVGIAKEQLKRLGEPFFTTKSPGKGMGLGVFLAQNFAHILGGTLHFTSKVNCGTTARLTLPSHFLFNEEDVPKRINSG